MVTAMMMMMVIMLKCLQRQAGGSNKSGLGAPRHFLTFSAAAVDQDNSKSLPGLHKLWYPGIRDTSMWSKFGAHGDVFLFSNLGVL